MLGRKVSSVGDGGSWCRKEVVRFEHFCPNLV